MTAVQKTYEMPIQELPQEQMQGSPMGPLLAVQPGNAPNGECM